MDYYPSISILTLSYNSNLDIFRQSLELLRRQNYPRDKIEQLLIDGGSTNGTITLAKSYGCKIIERPDWRDESEARKSLGIKIAKNQIILILATDNILVGEDWLYKMILPFMENKDIFCTFSMHNWYQKNMSTLTKYCALIGANDPPVCYLGKADKIPLDQHVYDKGEIRKELPSYYIVNFTEQTLPTLGDNGHMVRRGVIQKVNNKDPKMFLHTDAFFQLVQLGYTKTGVVKNAMIHHIGTNVFALYKRRIIFKEKYRDKLERKREYFIFDYRSSKDRWNLFKYIIFSLTFVEPFFRALRGYMKVREPAWFLHPIVCFVALIAYTYSELRFLITKPAKILQYIKW